MADEEKNSIKKTVNDTLKSAGAFGGWAATFGGWLFTSLLVILGIFGFLGVLFGAFGCIEAIPVIGSPEGAELGCAANAAMRILQIGGFVLAFTATAADFGLNRFVFNMETYIGQGSGIGNSIQLTWIIMRDVVNLTFIGGLIWASISLILQTGQQVGKLVVGIIIAALLVNFSYFFAGVVIDASNFVTRIIYHEAIFSEGDVWGFGDPGTPDKYLMTEKFMNATQLGSINDFDNVQDFVEATKGGGWALLIFSLFGLALFATAAWVFTSIFSLMVGRFITIVILLITSPVGILRFTNIPVVSEWGKWWWDALMSQAIFPPVLFFLLAVSFKVIDTMNANLTDRTNGSFTSLLSTTTFDENTTNAVLQQNLEIFFSYAVAIGLMYASMKISTNIAKQIATNPPTTGTIYENLSYKKAVSGAMGLAKGGIGALGALGNLPTLPFTNQDGRYRNLGEQLFRADVLRFNIIDPALRAFDPLKRRDYELYVGRKDAYNNALTEYDAAVKKHGKNSVEAQEALATAVEKYKLLKETERNEIDNLELDSRKKKGTEESHQEVQKNASEGLYVASSRIQRSQPVADPETAKKLATIDRTLKSNDKLESARDALAIQQEVQELLQNQASARAMLEMVRASQHGVSVLTPEILTHENMKPHITIGDLTVIANDKTVSDGDFDRIADAVSDNVHEAFRASPAAKLRKERSPRGSGKTASKDQAEPEESVT